VQSSESFTPVAKIPKANILTTEELLAMKSPVSVLASVPDSQVFKEIDFGEPIKTKKNITVLANSYLVSIYENDDAVNLIIVDTQQEVDDALADEKGTIKSDEDLLREFI
jgi:septin family protein